MPIRQIDPSAEPATPPERPLWEGIDVSAWQGQIDWQRVAATGKRFAWIKASEGASHVDARFAENWSGAIYAGVLRGAYGFLTTSAPAEEQARAFLRVYPGGGELAPVLDLERGINGAEPTAADALKWVRVVEAETGTTPWIYCSTSYIASHLQSEAGHELAALCRLWVASWSTSSPSSVVPWSRWDAWQYTNKGIVDGISGNVDLDVLRPDAIGLAGESPVE